MLKHFYILTLLLVSLFLSEANGQPENENKAKAGEQISAKPPLKDGVYFTLLALQHNKPSITKEQLIKSYYDKSEFTLSQWVNTQSLFYINEDSSKQRVNRDSLWGYVESGTPFIFLNGRFHKFSTVGSISIFTESYPKIRGSMAPVVTDQKTGTFIRILDFATGHIGDYNIENISAILEKDEELFKEFKSLKTVKERRKKMYRFVERYNDRHVLFNEG
jgi:hypothetical protein